MTNTDQSGQALLALEDGTVFHGRSVGVDGQSVGEVVFNTAMTGYQEILTDPSYAKQIVTLTYPQIGNTGINPEDVESANIHCAGLVIRTTPKLVSNWRANTGLAEYLRENGLLAIAGIDTRKLTRILREKGAQNGCIAAGERADAETALAAARAFPGLKGMDLAQAVSVSEPYVWEQGGWSLENGYRAAPRARYNVVAYDFGIKRNILRMLVDRGCAVRVVPAKTSADEVMNLKPDGVFLSNGPGDPEPCSYAIIAIQKLVESGVPVFGICLGHQLLALASGARTMKMKFGHHGANHPVKDLRSGQVLITSQNHGFAVDPDDLPGSLQVTHKSLFDNSIQGVERTDHPAFSFQGHPEASPGPHDVAMLFDRFVENMRQHKQGAA
ncbi:MAG: glutamine-hydrolyzing carbamoyl-phosphate synthase small subunit [Saprospiraceae bacterium]|nr:glutamine-hydrolyzing carbamoyl-phosphate synthase small subunit [Saprospiraceae bacterium]